MTQDTYMTSDDISTPTLLHSSRTKSRLGMCRGLAARRSQCRPRLDTRQTALLFFFFPLAFFSLKGRLYLFYWCLLAHNDEIKYIILAQLSLTAKSYRSLGIDSLRSTMCCSCASKKRKGEQEKWLQYRSGSQKFKKQNEAVATRSEIIDYTVYVFMEGKAGLR